MTEPGFVATQPGVVSSSEAQTSSPALPDRADTAPELDVGAIEELTAALAKVKMLSGLLPICSSCKNIRDDQGYWNRLEVYIQQHSDATLTHGICPDCARRLYPEIFGDRPSPVAA